MTKVIDLEITKGPEGPPGPASLGDQGFVSDERGLDPRGLDPLAYRALTGLPSLKLMEVGPPNDFGRYRRCFDCGLSLQPGDWFLPIIARRLVLVLCESCLEEACLCRTPLTDALQGMGRILEDTSV